MPEPSAALLGLLRAPGGEAELVRDGVGLRDVDGGEFYPLANGIPVLLPTDSPFSAADYSDQPRPTPALARRASTRLRPLLPSLSHNLSAKRNLKRMGELLRADVAPETALVLVVGGATLGEGMDALADDPSILLVEVDVAIGPRTELICDAHALPFADGVFDGVVCQAVLEHVADPQRVVAEIRRVLKLKGLVYTEIPFMQQVHEGAYDFTRFTYNGQRRLLRCFEEIDAGATGGPGMALGWSIRALLTALAGARAWTRSAANIIATVTLFWLKYLDRPLMRGARALDGASGIYFLGRARATPRSDEEIIDGYRGVNSGFSVRR